MGKAVGRKQKGEGNALRPLLERLRAALLEDLGAAGDVTSQALVPERRRAKAALEAKEAGVVCGVELLAPIFQLAAELVAKRGHVHIHIHAKDGARVHKGDVIASVEGSARALLAGERLAVNLLSHLSGVATQTATLADQIRHTRAQICDTRKTTPLWRDLEKYAVRCGGGANHRLGLYDMLLIKDNHLALWGARDPAGAVNASRKKFPWLPLEVEVTNLAGLKHVCTKSAPDMILLDNFSPSALAEAVKWRDAFYRKRCGKPPLLEASGGVSAHNIVAVAASGVERISIGALTHSARALDISLEMKF